MRARKPYRDSRSKIFAGLFSRPELGMGINRVFIYLSPSAAPPFCRGVYEKELSSAKA